MQSYQDLEVWKKAMDLAEGCYRATAEFPKSEVYGLTSQIRRAVVSIPANTAEGQGRQSVKEFLYFLGIARGFLRELETLLVLGHRVGYLTEETLTPLLQLSSRVGQMLTRLRQSLERRL